MVVLVGWLLFLALLATITQNSLNAAFTNDHNHKYNKFEYVACIHKAQNSIQHGNYTCAVTFLKRAIRLNPRRMDGYLVLANLSINVFANYHEAAQYCIDGLKIQSDNAELWQKLSEMMKQNKIPFDDICTLIKNTNNCQLMFQFGVTLVDQKTRLTTARSIFSKYVSKIDSTWWYAWYYLGVAHTLLEEHNKAITSLRKSIQLHPDWKAYYMLGSAYLQTNNNTNEARKVFERAIKLAPTVLSSSHDRTQLALIHIKLGVTLERMDSKNETLQLTAGYHYEQSLSFHPRFGCANYAYWLSKNSFDLDAAVETVRKGLKTNPKDDVLMGVLASIQTVMHKTDHNTADLFRTAIYQLNTTIAWTYMEYAKYLFHNHLQTNQNHTIIEEIETMLYKGMNFRAVDVGANSFKDEFYHQLALLKMQTLNNSNSGESLSIYDQMLEIYQQGLERFPTSFVLHLGKAYLLQNDHFKQYNQSIKLYQTAIQFPVRDYTNKFTIRKVNAMFNLASIFIDQGEYENHHRYLIEQGCKDLIKGLNGIIFFILENHWVGNFESTMKKFASINFLQLFNVSIDKSLIHETLGLYYESLNQYEKALMQFIMSIHYNNQNNNKNDLIMISHWKIAKISSRLMNTTQVMQYFLIAVNQSLRIVHVWKNYQLSELYYDFGYFFMTRMNDIWNATKYYFKSVELNPFNVKAKQQLDQIIEQNEHVFSQFDQCALCWEIMIDSFQSIHTNNCTHRFHKNCIDKWYQQNKKKPCPSCRKQQS